LDWPEHQSTSTVVNVVYLPFEWPPGMHLIRAPGYRVPGDGDGYGYGDWDEDGDETAAGAKHKSMPKASIGKSAVQ